MEGQDLLTPSGWTVKDADGRDSYHATVSRDSYHATVKRTLLLVAFLLLSITVSGCSFGRATPTRTPFPTWTPTPEGVSNTDASVAQAATATVPLVVQLPTNTALPESPTVVPSTPEPAAAPPTATLPPEPLPTEIPTETPIPEATPTAAFRFVLEAAEKFPTDSLAANVVRIYLYVYSPTEYGLSGYTLQVLHNGTPLTVDEESAAGVPEQTRDTPSPFTRFANMSIVFVEPQAGRWEIQLLDNSRAVIGPPVTFDLTADERTRELYVRYRQQ